MGAVGLARVPAGGDEDVLLLALDLVVADVEQRDLDARETLAEHAPPDPLGREGLEFGEQPAEGEGDAVGEEDLVVFVFELVLELEAVVLHGVRWHLVLQELIAQLLAAQAQVGSRLAPPRPARPALLPREHVRLQTLSRLQITAS